MRCAQDINDNEMKYHQAVSSVPSCCIGAQCTNLVALHHL